MSDARFPTKRGGGIVCPECQKVAVLGANHEPLPLTVGQIAWCKCGWAEREYPDHNYGRMFEIIWAADFKDWHAGVPR